MLDTAPSQPQHRAVTEHGQPVWSRTFLAVRPWIAYPLVALIVFGGDYRWIALGLFVALVAVHLFIPCPRCGSSFVMIGHRAERNGTIRCTRPAIPLRPSSLAGDSDHRHPTKEPVS